MMHIVGPPALSSVIAQATYDVQSSPPVSVSLPQPPAVLPSPFPDDDIMVAGESQ